MVESRVMKPRHLLLDLDDTLLVNRSLPLRLKFYPRLVDRLAERVGYRRAVWGLAQGLRALGHTDGTKSNQVRVAEAVAPVFQIPVDEAYLWVDGAVREIFPSLSRYFYPMPGAREFVLWARERYALTLATNPVWTRPVVDLRVRWAGLEPEWFGSVTDVTRMRACKPHGEYYLQILTELGARPDECLMIGNDRSRDLPARKVGIPVYLFNPEASISPLPERSASDAPAWTGDWPGLRRMLE